MSITFGGLATGIDTESIITELMQIERYPIDRLERDQAFYKSRLDAFSQLDEKLKTFLDKAEAIDTSHELNSPAVSSSSEGYLAATARSSADLGSYQVTVVDLAQQQKDVSQGYVDKSAASFGTGSINLTVDGVANSISIDATNNSLDGIAQAINNADLGVSAAIINDGTGAPYRLVLTGNSVSESFSLDGSNLGGGTAAPAMNNTQMARQAHIIIDGIDVYSDSNSVDAVPGLSMELLKADPAAITMLNVATDDEATGAKIQEFVDAYNEIITFIAGQREADWGNDSAFRSIKRSLQDFIVTSQGGSGSFSTLSQLGFETQRDGTLSLNGARLNSALKDDYAGVISLFSGEAGVEGISAKFVSYLEGATNFTDGIYAGRKDSTDSTLRSIDKRIFSLEARLELKERTLRAQFSAMEGLVSSLSAQGDYLMQQLASMPTIGNSN